MKKIHFFALFFFFNIVHLYARFGGGGGRGGGSHSGGGGFSSHGSGIGYSGGGGSMGSSQIIIIVIVIIIIMIYNSKQKAKSNQNNFLDDNQNSDFQEHPFPAGLDIEKIKKSFFDMQIAWQTKDVKSVRKWMSDGVYQRLNTQFLMMNKLFQTNQMSNIQVQSVKTVRVQQDGEYEIADVEIRFTLDDKFLSSKYPQFNEEYQDDYATEYWTYIKRSDSKGDKNLYTSNNCPNCGAVLDNNLGEISRCLSCKTLTNNASYDWVLSEITQEDDYEPYNHLYEDEEFKKLTTSDGLFSIQRMEDLASNIFMQTMNVMSGEDSKKLARFANQDVIKKIIQHKNSIDNYIFNRIYMNEVTLSNYNVENETLNLTFSLTASYSRIKVENEKLKTIDEYPEPNRFKMTLSKKLSGQITPKFETVYSYECPSCAAPYSDTTDDKCKFCGESVVDINKNWVLTDFMF